MSEQINTEIRELQDSHLVIREGRYVARLILPNDVSSVRAYQALRHEHFVVKKGWVKPDETSPYLEIDRYDDDSFHLGVFEDRDGEQLLCGYMRLTPWWATSGFMLDHEFVRLKGEDAESTLATEGRVELSRLVCRSDLLRSRKDAISPHPLELLLKLLYKITQRCGFICFYIVVEESWLKPFARRFGLPFRPVGISFVFPDGTRTVAAVATLKELESAMEGHNRDKHTWYRQT